MPDAGNAGILALAEEWAFPLPGRSAEAIAAYLDQLLTWNRRVNLTGARGLGELLDDHLPDSFALARLCPQGASVVDIGSGGGLPAIPFAILRPDCHVTLIEPRAKRTAFLHTATRICGSQALKVVRARMDEMPDCTFSVAVSRATFSPDVWLEKAPRLLSGAGIAVVFAAHPIPTWPASARLVEALAYSTRGGAPRWTGSFCFT